MMTLLLVRPGISSEVLMGDSFNMTVNTTLIAWYLKAVGVYCAMVYFDNAFHFFSLSCFPITSLSFIRGQESL